MLIAAATFLAYLPTLRCGFVWDDEMILVDNSWFHPVTAATLLHYWRAPMATLYMPVTTSVYWLMGTLDGRGLNPALFHLASITIHATNAALLFLLLRKLTGKNWAATVGAMIFAIHPIQVESVAYVGVLDTPLCAMFALLAMNGFLKFVDRPQRATYAWATAALVAAILAKPTAVVTPVLAGVLAMVVADGRVRRMLFSLLPWVAISGGFAAATMIIQPGSQQGRPLGLRLLMAGSSAAFYLKKILIPQGLCVDYGRNPEHLSGDASIRFTWLAAVLLIAIAWILRRKWPAAAAAIAIFLVGLLPTSGLVSFDFENWSITADRFAYLPMIGVALLAAAAMARWGARAGAAAAFALPALLIIQQRQIGYWHDDQTLFTRALAVNPQSWRSWGNLGSFYLGRREYAQAAQAARNSVAMQPDSLVGWENLGLAETALGNDAEAMEAFGHGVELAPGNLTAVRNYEEAKGRAGQR